MGTILDDFYPDHPGIQKQSVEHPEHYGGKENLYEAIKVIEAWGLGFNLGNTIKYISRAGRKLPEKELEDLEKARWYLDREIEKLRKIKCQSLI